MGLTVHEQEILDAQSLKNVARAKAQYNKKYREVRPAYQPGMQDCYSATVQQDLDNNGSSIVIEGMCGCS